MSTAKKLRVEFAPGAFDTFDGTQEELDQLMAEITNMFSGMTAQDLESQMLALDEDDLTEQEWKFLDSGEQDRTVTRGTYLQ